MAEFFSALFNPDIPFIRYALIAGILSGISFGVVGSYVVVKRISYIAGAIAHSVLGGIGLSLFLKGNYGITWFPPVMGALMAALLSAVIIWLVSWYGKEREDTIIGAIWSVGMAAGVLLIAKTPGYTDPMSYLFGNILIVSRYELTQILILDALILTVSVLFYNQLLAVSFDEEFARVRGLNTRLYSLILLLLIALTVVLMTTVIGIIMVIALLTFPPAVAGLYSRNLWKIMVFSALWTIFFTVTGITASYFLDTPSGSTIIMIAAVVYILMLTTRRLFKRRQPGVEKG